MSFATRILGLAAPVLVVVGLAAQPAGAALQVTQFQLTPSTTQVGAHPNLAFSAAFLGADNTAGIKDIALHMPAGLRVDPNAAPFCTKTKLIENRCPIFSKVGQIAVTGTAFGQSATINREIYNMKPIGGQKLKLGAIALPGIPIVLPFTSRADGGLDIGVTGVPKIGGPVTVQLDRLAISFKGNQKRTLHRKRKRIVKTLITNPKTCTPADTVLDVGFYDPAIPRVTVVSSYTPTGCE